MMTKNLLHTVMIKPEEKPIHPIDIAGLEAKIKEGYTITRVDKSDRGKKNLYYTAAESLNNLVSALKYITR